MTLPPAPQPGGDWYQPGAETDWQWQLLDTVNTSYDVALYDIDLFDSSPGLVRALQEDSRKVICYFSAGSSENWRTDFSEFVDSDMGNKLDGWEGERWLDIRSSNVSRIILSRLDLAKDKGCDGVEPDNVDGYTNETGFELTYEDQLVFNAFIATQAHERGLSIGLKNDGDQVKDLLEYFDFSVNEECHQYQECDTLVPFVSAGKPVLNVEYPDKAAEAESLAASVCPKARTLNLRTLILPLDLDDSFRISCDDS